MARDGHKIPYRGLNIGGQVISTLHRRPYKYTHINTIRAEHRAHKGKTTKPYISISRNRIHEMRDVGNIVSLDSGHMRLSTQARKTLNLVQSDPELTGDKLAKCVNTLANVLRNRKISRDRSVLEVAATVTGSTLSFQPSRNSRLPGEQIVPQEAAADLPALGDAQLQNVQPLPVSVNDGPDDAREGHVVPGSLAFEKPGPPQQQAVRRTITRHGTKVSYGLLTPGNSPVKTSGSQLTTIADEKDVEMDDTFTNNSSPTPSPGPGFDSPAPRGSELKSHSLTVLEDRIWVLMQEKAALLEKEQYVLRKLSRNGNGTLSNIEAVADRAVRQRDELLVENQELRAMIERLNSSVLDLQGNIVHVQDKLDRAQGERMEMAQSRRRWIVRMWTLAGRIPGELRKKDAEIENMREKLVDMHALLAQEQSRLQEVQCRFAEERKRRMDMEVEFNDSKTAHAQEIKERELAGQRLRGQLMNVVNGLESGAILI